MTRSVIAIAALLAAGCHQGADKPAATPGPAAGQERGACRPGGGCDHGLVCLSELCVRPPSADCAKVGESIAFLLLDNYAPREEREAVKADVAGQCQEQLLSVADGDCLIRAKSRADLRACPRLVGFGDCAKINAHLEGMRAKDGVDAYLVTGADRIADRCRTDSPTLAFERCVLAAQKLDDVDRCVW